jgi:hypothetical protein
MSDHYDATKAEPRNPTTGGETVQETTDRMAGPGVHTGVAGGAKGPLVTKAPPPQNLHPSAKGVYGSPVDSAPILGQRDGT